MRKITATLPETHPQLVEMWHYSKNKPLKPSDITYRSPLKVWWKCPTGKRDHIWQASVRDLAEKIKKTKKLTGCPCCAGKIVVKSNCLATTHPKLAKEWHFKKNHPLTPKDITRGTHKKVWWKCSTKKKDHVWFASITNRSRGKGCPHCRGLATEPLTVTHPEIAKLWHPTKNKNLTPDQVTFGNSKEVWWKCSSGHEWTSVIESRSRSKGCPYCLRMAYKPLSKTHPYLAQEWHPTKNGKLLPKDFTYGSDKKIWWKCSEDHVWETRISTRTRGPDCPDCKWEEREIRRKNRLLKKRKRF